MESVWPLNAHSLATLASAALVAVNWLLPRFRGKRPLHERIYKWAIVQARLRWANDQLRAQLRATEADRDWWATMARECAESRGMSVSADGLIDASVVTLSPPKRTPHRPSSAPNDASAKSTRDAPTNSPK